MNGWWVYRTTRTFVNPEFEDASDIAGDVELLAW